MFFIDRHYCYSYSFYNHYHYHILLSFLLLLEMVIVIVINSIFIITIFIIVIVGYGFKNKSERFPKNRTLMPCPGLPSSSPLTPVSSPKRTGLRDALWRAVTDVSDRGYSYGVFLPLELNVWNKEFLYHWWYIIQWYTIAGYLWNSSIVWWYSIV